MQESSDPAPSFGLSVKSAPKLAKALRSPYVVSEGKQIKPLEDVVLFQYYNRHAEDTDIADFQNWYQRGYKPHNNYK